MTGADSAKKLLEEILDTRLASEPEAVDEAKAALAQISDLPYIIDCSERYFNAGCFPAAEMLF